jgi:rod shape-determining protein MreD
MIVTLAAIASVVAALLELTIFDHLRIGGARPHPVLVLGVIWAIGIGIEGGLAIAFVGGLALDVLAQRPLGSSAFALLVAIGGAGIVGTSMGRLRPVAPVVAALVFSIVNSLILLGILAALQGPVPLADPLTAVLPGAVYDTGLAAILGPIAIAMIDRRRGVERVGW